MLTEIGWNINFEEYIMDMDMDIPSFLFTP